MTRVRSFSRTEGPPAESAASPHSQRQDKSPTHAPHPLPYSRGPLRPKKWPNRESPPHPEHRRPFWANLPAHSTDRTPYAQGGKSAQSWPTPLWGEIVRSFAQARAVVTRPDRQKLPLGTDAGRHSESAPVLRFPCISYLARRAHKESSYIALRNQRGSVSQRSHRPLPPTLTRNCLANRNYQPQRDSIYKQLAFDGRVPLYPPNLRLLCAQCEPGPGLPVGGDDRLVGIADRAYGVRHKAYTHPGQLSFTAVDRGELGHRIISFGRHIP